MLEKPGTKELSKNSSDFNAKIIPYDTCEDPNLPILASSGDDINLIFRIPKESFRKLAVAAIAHLGSNSDSDNAETSDGSKDSENNQQKRLGKTKFRLSDVVNDLGSENTRDIIEAYEEDSNTSESSKYKDISSDPKLCVNGNGTLEVDDESEYKDYETEKRSQNVKILNLQESSNDFENANISTKMSNLDSNLDLPTEGKCNEQGQSDAADRIEKCNISKPENKTSNDKETENRNNEDEHERTLSTARCSRLSVKEFDDCESGNKGDRIVLSDLNLDLSDCPELENAWPNIHPFTETEEIPIQEIKSLAFNGFITKYLKLELSNDHVVIKVTSESNVLVDAVKYKETGKKSTLETEENSEDDSNADNERKEQSGKESDYLSVQADISQVLEIAETSNKSVDLVDETDFLVSENKSEQKNKDLSTSKIECKTMTITVTGDSRMVSEIIEPKPNLKMELGEPTVSNDETLTENSSNHTLETESNSNENKSADETLDFDSPDKFLENTKAGEISLKIEEKFEETEEFDTNITSSSPTLRLKRALSESLKTCSSKIQLKEQSEELVANTSQTLSENSDSDESSDKSDEFHIKEGCLENSPNECVTESSEMDSNEMTVECHETEYSNKESNVESEYPETKHECTSPEKGATYNSSNKDESGNINEDSDETEKHSLNDHDFEDESSNCNVEETNTESFNKVTEEENSFEDSALGKDLRLSENEMVNDCSNFASIECNKVVLEEVLGNIPAETEENKSKETKYNEILDDAVDVDCTSKNKNEQCEQTAVEENCQAEVVTESGKMEDFVNSLAENIAKENDTSENTSTDKINDAENYETNNKEFKSEELKDVKVKIENSPENRIADVEIINETSGTESNEAYSKKFEKESLEPSSENSISETTDLEENLPENSFASNIDSFVDTLDVNVESASECGDLESDDVKSIASESDDSKDSDSKRTSVRRNNFKKNMETDEVDCAPTRLRRKKAIPELSKNAIPENAELRSTKVSSRYTSTLDTPSKHSGRISPIGRSLRSKSLEPTPQQSKGNLYDKKHSSVVESEETTRRTRAKTPDIIIKKDMKTTARSSPRKLARSSATTEPSSTSKEQSKKNSAADSKSRANLDSSISTKRSKRGNKE